MPKKRGVNPKDKFGLKKVPLRLIPPVALIYQSIPHYLGSEVKEYTPYNWRHKDKPIRYSVYTEAILRHLLLIMDGEDVDDESLAPHEASIMASCAIILDARLNNNLIDDRYKTGKIKQLMKDTEKLLVEQKKAFKKKKTR